MATCLYICHVGIVCMPDELSLTTFFPAGLSPCLIWCPYSAHTRATRTPRPGAEVLQWCAVRAEQYSNQEISNTLIALAKLEVDMDPRMVKVRPPRGLNLKQPLLY